MRRFAGLLSILLLFRLSLAGGLACHAHGQPMIDGQHAAMQMGGTHQAAADEAPLDCDGSREQCPPPAATDCCTAIASCVLFVRAANADVVVALTGESSPLADLLTASSGATRSETPPPRA